MSNLHQILCFVSEIFFSDYYNVHRLLNSLSSSFFKNFKFKMILETTLSFLPLSKHLRMMEIICADRILSTDRIALSNH